MVILQTLTLQYSSVYTDLTFNDNEVYIEDQTVQQTASVIVKATGGSLCQLSIKHSLSNSGATNVTKLVRKISHTTQGEPHQYIAT